MITIKVTMSFQLPFYQKTGHSTSQNHTYQYGGVFKRKQVVHITSIQQAEVRNERSETFSH